MSEILKTIYEAAALYGLNLIAAIPSERYDRAVKPEARVSRFSPEARSIVVIANGGGDFWRAFKNHIEADPAWCEREHPLDDFTRDIIENQLIAALGKPGVRATPVYPFTWGEHTLNFVELGKLAGIGGPSIIGVLLHPIYGPWIAFRAALLLDVEIDSSGDAIGFNPCPTCSARTCVSACPVGAIRVPAGWDVLKCLEHRVEVEQDCARLCHARVACVLGPEHRYPDDELAYHQMRALSVMRPYYVAEMKSRSGG